MTHTIMHYRIDKHPRLSVIEHYDSYGHLHRFIVVDDYDGYCKLAPATWLNRIKFWLLR